MNMFAAILVVIWCVVSCVVANPFDHFKLVVNEDNEDSTIMNYNRTTNVFTLSFNEGTVSTNNQLRLNFFDFECEIDKGNGEADGFVNATFSNNNGYTVPIMTFTVDMDIAKDSDTYTDDVSSARFELCVRNSIWTADNSMEVNFLETQITLLLNLTASVVTEAQVEKKEAVKEEVKQSYEIITTLCDNTPNPVQQGEMVTVCMEPNSTDVVIASLLDFAWTQTTAVVQPAIGPADQTANPLTTEPDCHQVRPTLGTRCRFASMLRADFYTNPDILVEGAGTALLALNGRRRRLSNGHRTTRRRGLQQDDLLKDVGIAFPLERTDDGPGPLRITARGASVGARGVTGAVALLLGATLLWI